MTIEKIFIFVLWIRETEENFRILLNIFKEFIKGFYERCTIDRSFINLWSLTLENEIFSIINVNIIISPVILILIVHNQKVI